jgi:TatD DNase family protein
MYFDTHCHLSNFKDIPAIISKAKANSVRYILAVSMYYRDNWNVLNLAKENSEVIPALGIHPIDVPNLSNLEQQVKIIENLLLENEVGTIGEIGLDHYFVKDAVHWEKQVEVLKHFLEWAVQHDLVVNLHGKYAEQDLFNLLAQFDLKVVVIHWFAGAPELIKEGINRGYYFSITPEVLYGERTQRLVNLVPVEHLLSESDGPVKYKGTKPFIGEPALMKDVIREIANIKQQKTEDIEQTLFKTAKEIFINK